MRLRHAWGALLVCVLALAAACAPGARHVEGSMSDADFDKVQLDSSDSSACSPEIDFGTFRGIAIAMPGKIALSRLDRVPVCGTFSFTPAQFARLPQLPLGLTFMVRDLDSNESFSGHFVSRLDIPEPEGGASAPDTSADDGIESIGGYFNINLVPAWHAPKRPGRYRVVFSVREWASAPVDFEVVK